MFSKERKPKNSEDLVQILEQYLGVHNRKLTTKESAARQDKTSKILNLLVREI